MVPFSRRDILALGAAGGAAVLATAAQAVSFGNPDSPAQGAINANPAGLSDPGPKNPALASQFPSFQSPPATDVGDMPLVLGVVQQCAQAYPERRLGAADYTG